MVITTFNLIIIIHETAFILAVCTRHACSGYCYMYNWYQFITQSFIIYTSAVYSTVYTALPLCIPTSTYLAPSSCDRNGPPRFQVARKLSPLSPIAPHCSPLLPCIHPSWVFPDPNVLLIRMHPNPSPSEWNSVSLSPDGGIFLYTYFFHLMN